MNWKEVSILTEGVCIEAVTGILYGMGTGGVVIEAPQAARKYVKKDSLNIADISPDLLNHEFVVIKAYFPEERNFMDELHLSLARVKENFGVDCRVFVGEVNQEDWEIAWKRYYHPFKVGERVVIKPSWEEYKASPDEILIEIDPGMAFGTGIHASTRFCLIFLQQYLKGGENVIDCGCGSGILSVAAAKLGAGKIDAMDIDDVAVRVARENIELNGLSDKIKVCCQDAAEVLDDMTADMIMANIIAEVVEILIPSAARVLPAGGYFFGSGIVDSKWPGVKKRLEENGFTIKQVLNDVEWVGVAAVKNA